MTLLWWRWWQTAVYKAVSRLIYDLKRANIRISPRMLTSSRPHSFIPAAGSEINKVSATHLWWAKFNIIYWRLIDHALLNYASSLVLLFIEGTFEFLSHFYRPHCYWLSSRRFLLLFPSFLTDAFILSCFFTKGFPLFSAPQHRCQFYHVWSCSARLTVCVKRKNLPTGANEVNLPLTQSIFSHRGKGSVQVCNWMRVKEVHPSQNMNSG